MAFDLFETLGKIASRDLQWYEKLSDEDKKGAAPFVLMRWLTGNNDRAQLVRINTFVNRYVFSLGQDKELLCGLLAAACTGKGKRFKWIKAPGSKSVKHSVEVIKQFYDVSTKEATRYQVNISGADLIEMAESLGWEKDELAKLKKEVSDEPGSTEKPSSGKKKSR